MTIELPLIDEGSYAAVATLTHKERQCLAGWLARRTAKQIALDLGITYHAVEKRLKSARAKLGVKTSLDAALLFAAAERYHRTVSQSPEMASRLLKPKNATATVLPSWWKQQRWLIFAGVSFMILLILATMGQIPQANLSNSSSRQVVEVQPGGEIDLDNPVAESFANLDLNKDGVLEPGEIQDGPLTAARAPNGGVQLSALTKQTLASFDSDKDGTVTRAEFEGGMALSADKRP